MARARRRHGPDPAAVRQWHRIFRDFAATLVGIFLCLYATTHVNGISPAALTALLGFGAMFLGAPFFLRLDERLRMPPDDEDER